MDDPFEINFEFRNQRFNDAEKGLIALGQKISVGVLSKLPDVLKIELRDYLDTVALALAKRHGNPWPTGTTVSSLSRRSGELINSISNSVAVYGSTLQDIYGTIGSDRVYAGIQEHGGTIFPKNAQYLTVPLPAALNADGTPIKARARDWDNTMIIKSNAGNLLIVQKFGGDTIPLYVLLKSVTIPPRLQMRATLESGMTYFTEKAAEAMLQAVQNAIKAA